MSVTFELPGDIERNLRRENIDLAQAAKEATLIEIYRRGGITQHELSRALGISRFEAEALLKNHNVTEDLPSASEYAQALAHLHANPRT
jgi:hypothetical protein